MKVECTMAIYYTYKVEVPEEISNSLLNLQVYVADNDPAYEGIKTVLDQCSLEAVGDDILCLYSEDEGEVLWSSGL